LLNFFYIK